jgi:hypothetical protein
VGAGLEEPGGPIFVDNFDVHIENMRFFHQRWMPSNQARRDWILILWHLSMVVFLEVMMLSVS